MAFYVTLYNFTDQGLRAVKESPARLKAGIQAAEAAGVKVHGAYYTEGPYDLVVIAEGDDDDLGAALTLSQAAQGNVRTLMMRAWDADGFAKILSMMP
jgi:uncharacterized protein with GYD domain